MKLMNIKISVKKLVFVFLLLFVVIYQYIESKKGLPV